MQCTEDRKHFLLTMALSCKVSKVHHNVTLTITCNLFAHISYMTRKIQITVYFDFKDP